MGSDPFVRMTILDAEVIFLFGEGDDPAMIENVDAELTLKDGSRWGATLLTYREIGRIMSRWRDSGEYISGAYLRIPDLIVTSEAGLAPMVIALEDILRGGLERSLLRLPR
jgi:hypothetical protein